MEIITLEIKDKETKKKALELLKKEFGEKIKIKNIKKKTLPDIIYNPIEVESYSPVAKREEIYDR